MSTESPAWCLRAVWSNGALYARQRADAGGVAVVRGARIARRIMEAPPMEPYRGPELQPGAETKTREELLDYARDTGTTVYHPVGTCKMGSDPMAVVDECLRVRGLDRLRVADASIMPALVSGNTNAPVIMIAEKAADLVREDARAA